MIEELEIADNRTATALDVEQQLELSLRPTHLAEYIGQPKVKDNLKVFIKAALRRREALDHVLLTGPPGLGKCITADSLILTSHGIVQFSDILPTGMKPDESRPLEIKVFGINGVEKTSHVYCSGVVPTIRITTRSGFVIEGTPHHPVLVASADGPKWKQLQFLSDDDFVAIGRGMNLWNDKQHKTHWMPDDSYTRRQRTEAIVSGIHSCLVDVLGRPPAAIEMRRAYSYVTKRKVGNDLPRETALRLNLPLLNGHDIATLRTFPDTFRPSIPNTEREIILDEDYAYLLGVLIGDGNIEKGEMFPAFVITCEEIEMQTELKRIVRKHFDKEVKAIKYGEKAAKMRFSQTLGQVCLGFGVKAVNAKDKTVPSAIMTSPREVVIGFLQGLFDADGCSWPDGYIEFYTRSEQLSKQVQLLLANLGIIAHRKSKIVTGENFWLLFIGGYDAVKFHEIVSFRLSRKRVRFDALKETKRGWSRSELVPFANDSILKLLRKSQPLSRSVHKTFDHVKRNDRTPTRQQIRYYLSLLPENIEKEPEFQVLESLTDEGIYWDKVADKNESKAAAFDFVVPETHSFIANGFFNHNTTLAQICANEMGAEIKSTAAPVIEKSGDLAALLTNLQEGDVLFIDEIHRLNPAIEEILYPAMEDYHLDLMIGQGTAARSIKLELPKFTLVGATTRPGLITAPLRGRFGIVFHLDFYPAKDLETIVNRSAKILNIEIDEGGSREIARRARGTPRIANRLLRRVRDFAEVVFEGSITQEVANDALNRMEVDTYGLDEIDRKMLLTIIEKFEGGPVGLGTISASIHEEKDSIEEIIEPYLIQTGFLNRTPRGRVATRLAYEHFGLNLPKLNSEMPLFEK